MHGQQHCGQPAEAYPGDQPHADGNQKAGAGEHGTEEEGKGWTQKDCNSSHN